VFFVESHQPELPPRYPLPRIKRWKSSGFLAMWNS
jgi:hypothetical protein